MSSRLGVLVSAFVAAAATLAAIDCSSTDISRRTRVVLITLDTLRLDSLLGNGEGRRTDMPLTLAWARSARIFTRYHSATSSTQPTHATLFTGLHPWQHGMSGNTMIFPDHLVTVPALLEEAGFETAAVVASLPVSATLGFGRGFGRFDERFEDGKVPGTWKEVSGREDGPYYRLADSVTPRALAELERSSADRQFLWVHFYDAHSPYGERTGDGVAWPRLTVEEVNAGRVERASAVGEARRLYDADVAFLDRQLARLLGALEEDERFETHIVLVSDHGESFGEDDSMAHGKRLTPPQIRVPLLIRSPAVEAGIDRRIAATVDLAPTLLTLAGLEAETGLLANRGGGRALTRPATGREVAFGMRRTFAEPFHEQRLDGSTYVHDHEVFFRADSDGSIVRGNSDFLLKPLPDLGEKTYDLALGERTKELFRGFEEELGRSRLDGLKVREALEALEALGYVN